MVAGLFGGFVWATLGLGKLWKSVNVRDAACRKSMAEDGRKAAWRGFSILFGVAPTVHLLEDLVVLGGGDNIYKANAIEMLTRWGYAVLFYHFIIVAIPAVIFCSTFGDPERGRRLRRTALYALLAIVLTAVAAELGPVAVSWFDSSARHSPYWWY